MSTVTTAEVEAAKLKNEITVGPLGLDGYHHRSKEGVLDHVSTGAYLMKPTSSARFS